MRPTTSSVILRTTIRWPISRRDAAVLIARRALHAGGTAATQRVGPQGLAPMRRIRATRRRRRVVVVPSQARANRRGARGEFGLTRSVSSARRRRPAKGKRCGSDVKRGVISRTLHETTTGAVAADGSAGGLLDGVASAIETGSGRTSAGPPSTWLLRRGPSRSPS